MKLRPIAVALLFALSAIPARAEEPTPLSIAADKPGPVISADIFGQFAEQLGEGIYGGVWVGPDSPIPNVRGIRSDVVQALRALKVPNVRWPGGCHADRYDWRDGVGPAAERKTHVSMWGNVLDPNTFGTHEFMDFVEQIGSEAYISVNVGSGTPQQASDWMEYMTSPLPTTLAKQRIANGRKEPWRIKFLGLGNENWGCGGNMSAAHYVEEMKQFATLTGSSHPDQVHSPFMPPSKFPMRYVAVGQTIGETAYTEAVMQAWKGRVPYAWNINALSLHFYTGQPTPLQAPSHGFGEREYAVQLADTLRMESMIAEHSAIMDRTDPDKKVALAIDEWGLWLKPEGKNFLFLRQQNSLRDAIAAALNFNIFIRHADRVRQANIAQMVNVIQSMILTDGAKMVLTPTYYVHRMYVPFQDATVLPVNLTAGTYSFEGKTLPRLDTVAARAKDGSVWLALTNVDPNAPAQVNALVAGLRASTATGEVLTAAKVDAINTFDVPFSVTPKPYLASAKGGKLVLTVPPKSVVVVRLQP